LCDGEDGVYDSCLTSSSDFLAERQFQVITVMLDPDTPAPF
jgi:hypothetical protein